MIAIIDYGVGNLFSLTSSLRYLGLDAAVTADPAAAAAADRIILPGVGAFADAAAALTASGMDRPVLDAAAAGRPVLGICLGMQLLFEKSYEYGVHAGLGLIPGQVRPLAGQIPASCKIPHMGWNRLDIRRADPLFAGSRPDSYVYYVHSYYADCPDETVLATSEYGIPVPGVVRAGSVWGCQFHPEKSGADGLAILSAFAAL